MLLYEHFVPISKFLQRRNLKQIPRYIIIIDTIKLYLVNFSTQKKNLEQYIRVTRHYIEFLRKKNFFKKH